jgi:hypothetical protein
MSHEHETENIARQNDELALIEAIYPSEFFTISPGVLSPPSNPFADAFVVSKFWTSLGA